MSKTTHRVKARHPDTSLRRATHALTTASPVPDSRPLACIGSQVLGAPPHPRISLTEITLLVAARYDLNTAVVILPDRLGVCLLGELAQVALVELPAEVRDEKSYTVFRDSNIFMVGKARAESDVLARAESDVLGNEKQEWVVHPDFEQVIIVLDRDDALTLFDKSGEEPVRVWPAPYQGRLEFFVEEKGGYKGVTVEDTLAYRPAFLVKSRHSD